MLVNFNRKTPFARSAEVVHLWLSFRTGLYASYRRLHKFSVLKCVHDGNSIYAQEHRVIEAACGGGFRRRAARTQAKLEPPGDHRTRGICTLEAGAAV